MSVQITVVIPAYNASQYIGQTLEGVLQQTFSCFEVLVIDDGSTDHTAAIVQAYEQQDKRVKLISQPNQGVSVARNTGIQLAKGALIAFLDADDQWLPHKLKVHFDHFRDTPALGLSFGKIEFMTSQGQPTGQYSNPRLTGLEAKHLYYENTVVSPSNAVIRRAALEQVGGFDLELSGVADAELFLRLLCYGWKVVGIDQVLVRYRTNAGGMSSQLYLMEEDWQRLTQKVQMYAPELVSQHYKAGKAMLLRYLARRALRLHLPSEVGVEFMGRGLQTDAWALLQEPRRTLLTLIAVYGQCLIGKLYPHAFLHPDKSIVRD